MATFPTYSVRRCDIHTRCTNIMNSSQLMREYDAGTGKAGPSVSSLCSHCISRLAFCQTHRQATRNPQELLLSLHVSSSKHDMMPETVSYTHDMLCNPKLQSRTRQLCISPSTAAALLFLSAAGLLEPPLPLPLPLLRPRPLAAFTRLWLLSAARGASG